jgi:tetratricopeptide (TPR) repeat protein
MKSDRSGRSRHQGPQSKVSVRPSRNDRCGPVLSVAAAFLLALAFPSLADTGHEHKEGDPTKLGKVHFPISCGAASQKKFDAGLAMLHSFWYAKSDKAFADLAAADPHCAMAHWGVAMSRFHQIWEAPPPDDLKAGVAAIAAARAAGAKTQRERDYVEVLAVYYDKSDTLDHVTRFVAYEKATGDLAAKYPKDREASIFYGLALNGVALALPPDKTYARQKKAGEILEPIFKEMPQHPGIAHYIIHSYDYPPLAERAVDAARKYAKIAPDSPHALHMPSHIFTRLGLWEDSIGSNLDCAAAARKDLDRTMPGAFSFDELHAMDYLAYAYLQTGRDAEARKIVERASGAEKFDKQNFAAAYALTAIPARLALERRNWSEAAQVEMRPAGFAWNKFPWTESTVVFARAIGFARSGNVASARTEIDRLEKLRDSLKSAGNVYWADQVEISRRQAAAWLARAEKKDAEALELMRSAAALEDTTDKHPVTPGPVLPAREQLGDLLLELGKPAEALAEYRADLTASPNRLNGLYGAARAARLSGDTAAAKSYYEKVLALCGKADGAKEQVAEARAFLEGKAVSELR